MRHFRPAWSRYIPERHADSLVVTSLLSAGVGFADVLIATHGFGDYGLVLFLLVPCAMGVLAPLLHGVGAPRTFLQCFLAGTLSQMALFAGMMFFGVEGLGCIIMAAPLWMACAAIGCAIAYPLHRLMWSHYQYARGFPLAALLILLLVPTLMGAEHVAAFHAPEIAVTSTVEVNAPPEIVWRRVISFPDLPPPRSWLFTLGTAYPIRAEILGHGVGAERHCVFSTGPFVEPITVWDENHRFAFDVTHCPPSMQEWSPFPNLHPPHLNGYFVSRRGQFLLTPLPNGHTRLDGTTWYRNEMFPVAYWQLWSDAIIHNIHLEVLHHIQRLAEQAVVAPSAPSSPAQTLPLSAKTVPITPSNTAPATAPPLPAPAPPPHAEENTGPLMTRAPSAPHPPALLAQSDPPALPP